MHWWQDAENVSEGLYYSLVVQCPKWYGTAVCRKSVHQRQCVAVPEGTFWEMKNIGLVYAAGFNIILVLSLGTSYGPFLSQPVQVAVAAIAAHIFCQLMHPLTVEIAAEG